MNRNVTSTILIVLALGIYFTVTQDIFGQAQAVAKENGTYISAIKNGEELIKVRDEVEHTYNSISQDDKDRIERLLPTSVDNIRLVIELTNIANQHGFQLDQIQAKTNATAGVPVSAPVQAQAAAAPTGDPTLHSVTISFATTAPYQQFISFLRDLENNLHLMDITRIEVKAKDTGNYDYSVEFETYYLAP